MRIAFFLGAVLAVGLGSSDELGQCRVDGHGPYPKNLKACEKLALNQARSNCILNKNKPTAEMELENSKTKVITKKSFRCRKACELSGCGEIEVKPQTEK